MVECCDDEDGDLDCLRKDLRCRIAASRLTPPPLELEPGVVVVVIVNLASALPHVSNIAVRRISIAVRRIVVVRAATTPSS